MRHPCGRTACEPGTRAASPCPLRSYKTILPFGMWVAGVSVGTVGAVLLTTKAPVSKSALQDERGRALVLKAARVSLS